MTLLLNPNDHTGKKITRGAFPKEAQSLYLPLNFALDTTIVINLPMQTGISNQTGLDAAQSLFVDNSDNATVVEFVFDNGFQVTMPPYCSGIFPLLIDTQAFKCNATSAGGVMVKVWITNTREQPAIWTTKFPLAGTVNVTGSVIYSTPTPGAFTDASAALALGGSSEVLIAADGNRTALVIKNPGTPTGQGIAAPEPAYINFGGAAAIGGLTSIELLPGETITAANLGLTSTQAIHWIAASTGHQLTCKVA
jgi:hypothetical protein